MIRKVSFDEAKQIMDDFPSSVLIDVREEAEYITGHAIDAMLFPVDEITEETAAEQIPSKNTKVLLYCRSGLRSAMAAQKLERMGYQQIYDIGSLIGWPYGLE